MKVVVIGATGAIGKAVTTLLTDKGHEIVQASRNTKPSLKLDDPASIEAFYKTLGEVEPLFVQHHKAAVVWARYLGFPMKQSIHIQKANYSDR